MDPKMNLEEFVQKCPANLSGADFYAVTNKARQNAIRRLINLIENETNLSENLIVLTETDFEEALVGFQANLSDSQLLDYENYFNRFSNKK